ncbi:hypothetical protein D039_2769A, partial [Vibrio parahaemolyticus EKP-028]
MCNTREQVVEAGEE